MRAEDIMNRIELLGSRIMENAASKSEVVEWLELTSNGNPIRQNAIQILSDNIVSEDGYPNGYFDGFTEAKNLVENGKDLSSYTPDKIGELASWVKENFA